MYPPVSSWFTYMGLGSIAVALGGLVTFMKGGRKVRTVYIVSRAQRAVLSLARRTPIWYCTPLL